MLTFDTNILVYAADRQAGARHVTSAKLLGTAVSANAALNEQSLIEFVHVVTRKQKLPLSHADAFIRAWLGSFALLTSPATIIDDTMSLSSTYALSIWDAHMLALCAGNGCGVLLSEDLADGAVYGGVHVLNPFNPKNAQPIGRLLLP